MKVFHYLPKNIGSFAIFSILLTACVNHISEENEAIIADGNIPLKFVTDIHELINTRIVGNSFEEGEGVGLFALAGSTTMQEERYVDNLHFVRSSGGEFLSDELVYYPDDGVTLNLVSYYPYRQEGVAIGESTMSVSVETNQEVAADYSRSDFLVAIRDGVSASIDAIPLTYNHKFLAMWKIYWQLIPTFRLVAFIQKQYMIFRSSLIPIIWKKMLLSRPEYGR